MVLITCLPAPMLLGISGEFTIANDAVIVLTGSTDNMSACPYAVKDIR